MSFSERTPGTGALPVTVTMTAKKRWIPAASQVMYNDSIINNTSAGTETGTIHRAKFTPYASFSRLALAMCNVGTRTSIGEVLAGGASGNYDDIRKAANKFQASAEKNGANAGAFTWRGITAPCMTDAWVLSAPLAVSLVTSDTFWVRTGIHKFDTTVNSQTVPSRGLNRYGSANAQRNTITTSVDTWVTGTLTTSSNDCHSGIIYGEVADATLNAALIEGDSLGYGFAGGWWVTSVQGTNPLSNTVDGATSDIEFALYRVGDSSNGVVYKNNCEPNSALWQWVPQSSFTLSGNPVLDPGRHTARWRESETIGFTDNFISLWTNEFANFNSSWNETPWMAGMEEMVRYIIKRNQNLLRRTWFVVDPIQTTWTGGGTYCDTTLSDSAFLDAQTPNQNTVPAGNVTALHERFVAMLDRVCKELGSAWVYNRARFYQAKNVRGEYAFKKAPDGVGGFFSPVFETSGILTHPGHRNVVICGADMMSYFPTKNKVSGWPPFGLLNPF